MNVLFITEDNELREAAAEMLGDHGMDVIGEDSIAAAQELLDETRPAFVVIGEHVEGGSPFDLFNYILEYHPSIPTVILADTMTEAEMDRRPEKVMRYDMERLEVALESLAETIRATVELRIDTLYPTPEDEAERVEVLDRFDFDALKDAPFFDELTRKGAETFDVPMCYVGVIDTDKETFLACHGVDFDVIDREQTICSYAIITDEVMVVEDVQNDPRFRDMASIGTLDMAWYASAPIIVDGHRVGTFCIGDTEHHAFSDEDKEKLQELAAAFAEELERYSDT